MTSEFDNANILGVAKLTQSQREFIENEPADLLRKDAIYVLQPQLPVPKVMHIHGKEITSYRFTAIEIVDGKYQRCVKIKVTSFMSDGEINGVPFNNRDIILSNVWNLKTKPCRIVMPIAIEYLGQGKFYNGPKSEGYCEAFKIHEDNEGYCQKFSLADLCPQIRDYLIPESYVKLVEARISYLNNLTHNGECRKAEEKA